MYTAEKKFITNSSTSLFSIQNYPFSKIKRITVSNLVQYRYLFKMQSHNYFSYPKLGMEENAISIMIYKKIIG